MKLIGVDIGGTKISSGLIIDGEIIKTDTRPTYAERSKEEIVNSVIESIASVFDPEVEGIGIGVPGLFDHKENMVIDISNIPSWDVVPLPDMVSKHFNKPVYVDNDANCFAVGEKHFGKGKPYSNFVGVTLGTGLGAGIIINNKLYSGNFSGAGEFGMIYYNGSIVEDFCSGQFFKRLQVDGKRMAQNAATGDPDALKLFHELGTHIGRALANILFTLAPEAIVLGGSVSKSFRLFEPAMMKVLVEEFPYKRVSNAVKIEISDAENMGILGAGSLVLDGMK